MSDSSDAALGVQSFADAQEWRLNRTVRSWKEHNTETTSQKQKQQRICIACSVTRRPGFFIWNMFIIMFLICSLAFCTFVVSVEKPENRLQLSFTLVLTTIAFKFVANQTIPRISYLTFLDKYILISMTIMCCICVWHSVVHLLPKDSNTDIHSVDTLMLVILASIYVAFHIIFILCIVCRVATGKKRRWRVFNIWSSNTKKGYHQEDSSTGGGHVNHGMRHGESMYGEDDIWDASIDDVHGPGGRGQRANGPHQGKFPSFS